MSGASLRPQFPAITVVTPWLIFGVMPSADNRAPSSWVCASMNPGARILPPTSMSLAAAADRKLPMAAILPASTATSPAKRAAPVPSMMIPLRRMRSCFIVIPLRRSYWASLFAIPLPCGAHSGVRVLNDDAHFPEGPARARASPQIFVEPIQCALHGIRAVRRIAQTVALARIDHDGGRNVQGFQRVPKFLGLRGRTLDVAFSHVLECGGLDVANEIDGR